MRMPGGEQEGNIMAVERIIGVDFGTSTSVIRVKRYENGEPVGEKLETKEVIFGNSAMVPTLIMKKDDELKKTINIVLLMKQEGW